LAIIFFLIDLFEIVIHPLLISIRSRRLLGSSSCRGETPPVVVCGQMLL
jgi:hypothetical protein